MGFFKICMMFNSKFANKVKERGLCFLFWQKIHSPRDGFESWRQNHGAFTLEFWRLDLKLCIRSWTLQFITKKKYRQPILMVLVKYVKRSFVFSKKKESYSEFETKSEYDFDGCHSVVISCGRQAPLYTKTIHKRLSYLAYPTTNLFNRVNLIFAAASLCQPLPASASLCQPLPAWPAWMPWLLLSLHHFPFPFVIDVNGNCKNVTNWWQWHAQFSGQYFWKKSVKRQPQYSG